MLNKAASFLEVMGITPSIRETVTQEGLGLAPGEGGQAPGAGQPVAIPPTSALLPVHPILPATPLKGSSNEKPLDSLSCSRISSQHNFPQH